MKNNFKNLFSAVIGGFLEFYDFTLYGFMVSPIQAHFFPFSDSKKWGVIDMYLVFAIGFFARPLGACIFGSIGDKYGRKVAFSYSLILMAASTLCMGLLPGYSAIGMAAPLIVVFSRLLQGISTGGEYSGGLIFALEHTEKRHQSFVGGFISAACMLGILFASVVSYCLQRPGLPDWSWRLAFVLGFLVSLAGIYIRTNLLETQAFLQMRSNRNHTFVQEETFFQVLKANYKKIVIISCITGFNGVVIYANMFCMSAILEQISFLSPTSIFLIKSASIVASVLSLALFGYLGDKINQLKLMITGLIGSTIAITLFYGLSRSYHLSFYAFLLCQVALSCLFGMFSGPMNSFLPSLFKAQHKHRSFSLGYNIGMGLLGGSAPFFCSLLIKINPYLFVGYIMVLCCLSLIFLMTLNNNRQQR